MSTISYYDHHAERFFRETVDADMSALRNRFAELLPPGGIVLDAGCGSGRDAKAFRKMGFEVVAFDASAEMVRYAQAHTGLPVQHMTFEDVCWIERFDGVWASASLLHVPRCEMKRILARLSDALLPRGVLYASFKRGHRDGISNGRHFTDMTVDTLRDTLEQVGRLKIEALWQSRDMRVGREHEFWTNCLAVRR